MTTARERIAAHADGTLTTLKNAAAKFALTCDAAMLAYDAAVTLGAPSDGAVAKYRSGSDVYEIEWILYRRGEEVGSVNLYAGGIACWWAFGMWSPNDAEAWHDSRAFCAPTDVPPDVVAFFRKHKGEFSP